MIICLFLFFVLLLCFNLIIMLACIIFPLISGVDVRGVVLSDDVNQGWLVSNLSTQAGLEFETSGMQNILVGRLTRHYQLCDPGRTD